MRALQLLVLFPLLLLMGCEADSSSKDQEEVIPPEYQRITRNLLFSHGIEGTSVVYALSGDNRLLAMANSNLLQFWDVQAKRLLAQHAIHEHGRPIKMCFSSSGKEIFIQAKDKLSIWDVETESWNDILQGVVEVSRNMKYAAQKDVSCGLRIFSLTDRDTMIVSSYYRPGQIAFSPNERYFASLDDGDGGSIVYDLEERTRVFNGRIKTFTIRNRMVLSNDGKKLAGNGTPATQLVLIRLTGPTSSSLVTKMLTEVEQAAKNLVFSSNSEFLCIDTYKPGLRIYNSRNLREVFAAKGLVVKDQTLIDDHSILYAGHERSLLSIDQQTLQPLDTINRVMNMGSFHDADNQVFARPGRRGLFLKNLQTKTIDTLELRSLYTDDAYYDRFASTELIRPVEVIYAYPLSPFDLRNLRSINPYDLVQRNTDFVPEERSGIAPRQYSPNWKYKIEGNKILDCTTGEVVMVLPLDLSSEWIKTYSLSEERLMLYNSKLQHIMVVDLVNRSILVNEVLPYYPTRVVFSPAGDFYVVQKFNSLEAVEFFELGRKVLLPYWYSIYSQVQSISDFKISANGNYFSIGIASYRGSPESSLWSTETGKLVYRSGAFMTPLPQDGEVLLQYTDSLKRVATTTSTTIWSVPVQGRISRLKVAANGKYFTYMKDGTYHCFADLETGKELWELGVSSNRQYFVKSSEYPIVYTNHDKFLQQFFYRDPLNGEVVYPAAEELRDTSEYLIRLTRQYLD